MPSDYVACQCTNPDCDGHDNLKWPRERVFLSQSSAESRARRLREMGAEAAVQRSKAIEWDGPNEFRLRAMVDDIGIAIITHGERGPDLDKHHPGACLCGELDYMACPAYLSGEGGISDLVITADLLNLKGELDGTR